MSTMRISGTNGKQVQKEYGQNIFSELPLTRKIEHIQQS